MHAHPPQKAALASLARRAVHVAEHTPDDAASCPRRRPFATDGRAPANGKCASINDADAFLQAPRGTLMNRTEGKLRRR